MVSFRFGWLFLWGLSCCGAGGLVGAEPSGRTLPELTDVELTDLQGKSHALGGVRAARLTVLVFLGTECPVSNGYAPSLKRLHETYASRGVRLLGVHCDPDVSPKVATDHAQEYQLPFPLVLDHEQIIARRCSVRVVPTAVVVAADGRIAYRGQIDNRYVSSGVRRPAATEFDLQAALDAALAGRAPQPAVNEPFGCPLPPPRSKS